MQTDAQLQEEKNGTEAKDEDNGGEVVFRREVIEQRPTDLKGNFREIGTLCIIKDEQKQDEPAPESDVGKEKWYVYGKTFDEIRGSVEESNVKRGPFDTSDEAEFYRDVLDEERTISGQHLYYDLYVDKEEAAEEVPDDGGEQ